MSKQKKEAMTTTNQKLSDELFKLSGWDDTYLQYTQGEIMHIHEYNNSYEKAIPAYDLGYLLGKLPQPLTIDNKDFYFVLEQNGRTSWKASYWYMKAEQQYSDLFHVEDTPEDAAAKLCCELIRQGKLKP